MNLPDIRYGWRKHKSEIVSIRGVNYSDQIADGDLADSAGLSTRRFPYFSTRHARPAIEGYEDVTAAYRYKDDLLTVADEKLYWTGLVDGEKTTQMLHTVLPGAKQFVTINTKVVVFPDKLMLDMTSNPPTVRDMEASFETISSGVRLENDKIVIPKTPVADVGALPMEVKNFRDQINGYWFRTYSGLTWDADHEEYTWSGNPAWKELGTTLQVGDILIPMNLGSSESPLLTSQMHTNSDYRTAPSSAADDDNSSGGGYALQVKRFYFYYYEEGVGRFRYLWVVAEFNVLDIRTASTQSSLKTIFRAGDAVSITGHPLPINNKKTAALVGVSDDTLTFAEGTFTPATRVGTLDAANISDISAFTADDCSVAFTGAGVAFLLTKHDGEYCFMHGSGQSAEYLPVREGQHLFSDGNPATYYVLDVDETKFECTTESLPTQKPHTDVTATEVSQLRLTITRAMPQMDYICEKDNRLWGVVNHQENRVWDKDAGEHGEWKTFESRMIVASSLGEPDDFYDYTGAYGGAYAVAVASEGDFTGITAYGDSVLAWKEKRLCKVMGDYPSNYQLHEYVVDGLQAGAHGTQVNISETLLYKGVNGVYAYGGGTPRLISPQFGERRYTAEAAGTDGERYYITLTDSDGNHHLHSYDVQRGLWLRESDDNVVGYVEIGGAFSALKDDGHVYLVDAGEDDPNLDWYAQFTPLYETIDGKKRYSKLLLRMEFGRGAFVRILERVDGSPWQQVGRITAAAKNPVTVPVPIARGDKMEFKLEGHGACTILGIERQFFLHSEV